MRGACGFLGCALVGVGCAFGSFCGGALLLALGAFGGCFQVADAAAAEVLPVHSQLAAFARGLVIVGSEVLEHGRDLGLCRCALYFLADDLRILVGAHRQRGADALEASFRGYSRRLLKAKAIAGTAASLPACRVDRQHGGAWCSAARGTCGKGSASRGNSPMICVGNRLAPVVRGFVVTLDFAPAFAFRVGPCPCLLDFGDRGVSDAAGTCFPRGRVVRAFQHFEPRIRGPRAQRCQPVLVFLGGMDVRVRIVNGDVVPRGLQQARRLERARPAARMQQQLHSRTPFSMGISPPARRFPYTTTQAKTIPTCGNLQKGMIYGETNLPCRLLRS